jgi:hypothetical protein
MAAVTSCPSCGARIDAAPAAEAFVYTCRFCNARVPIEPLVRRPPAGVPPVVHVSLTSAADEIRAAMGPTPRAVKAAAGGIGCFITLMTLLPFLIIGAVFGGPKLWNYFSGHYADFPLHVPVNGSLELSDRDGAFTDTLVTVGVNGKLTIRNCHLKAPLLVKAGTNAHVTIIDSTLEGEKGIVEGDTNLVVTIENSTITSGEEIVDAPVNAKVDVSKGSKLLSAAVAFPFEANGEIAIDHSSVEGKLGAIELKVNGRLKLTDEAVVKSDGPAIELTQNGHLTITGSRVESKTEAVRASSNLEGTLRNAVLVGPKAALDLGDRGRLTLAQTILTGPTKNGPSTKIDER